MAQPAAEQSWIRGSASAARWVGVGVSLIGILALIGWWADITVLRELRQGLAPMKPNTAFCFAVAGAGLASGTGLRRRNLFRLICGCAVAAVGLLSLGRYFAEFPDLTEHWLVGRTHQTANLRMTIGAAASFCCIGVGLILTAAPPRAASPARAVESTLACAGTMLGLLALLGYLYGARSLYQTIVFTSMALHTAIAITLLGIGLLLSRPRQGLMRLISSTSAGGAMARRLLAFFLVMAPLMGWLRLRGQELDLYDTPFGLALLVWCMTLLGTAIVWWTSRALDKADHWRASLQEDLADSISREHATAAQRGSILDAIPSAIVLLDDGGLVRAVNRRWVSLIAESGAPRRTGSDAFVNWAGAALGIGPSDWTDIAAGIAAVLKSTRPGYVNEVAVRPPSDHPNGNGNGGAAGDRERERWLEVRVAPVISGEGSRAPGAPGLARGVVVTVSDVTERRRLEEQLVHAQRLEAVGRLAGGVAHDFNNLLTAVVGHTALARSEIEAGRAAAANLKAIEQAARSGAELTQELLAFGRRQVLSTRIVSIAELVANVRRLTDRSIGESVHLNVAIPSGVWPIRVDPGRIEQVLMNLVLNARDAIQQSVAVPVGAHVPHAASPGAPGSIVIEAVNTVVDHDPGNHPDIAPGRYVCVSVSDSGVGMSKSVMDRVFEPFFTTKGLGKGTGLGLATSFGIVKQHGGHIAVYSEEGHGSTFRVYLPAAEGESFQPVGQQQPGSAQRGSERILLVDDHPGARGAVAGMLQSLGYTVVEAGDAAEALRVAKNEAGAIDLLLCDVVLPDAKGPDLARRIAPLCPGAAVLFISGYTANALAGKDELDPGVHFLSKPFSREELAARVRTAIDARPRKD